MYLSFIITTVICLVVVELGGERFTPVLLMIEWVTICPIRMLSREALRAEPPPLRGLCALFGTDGLDHCCVKLLAKGGKMFFSPEHLCVMDWAWNRIKLLEVGHLDCICSKLEQILLIARGDGFLKCFKAYYVYYHVGLKFHVLRLFTAYAYKCFIFFICVKYPRFIFTWHWAQMVYFLVWASRIS